VGDHTPDLQRIERMLAAKGLKDPWIRNEVWRFDTTMHGTWWERWRYSFGFAGRGFLIGMSDLRLGCCLEQWFSNTK